MTQPIQRPNHRPAPIAARPKRLTLANINRGILDKPIKLCIYGAPGIGKSTFVSKMPRPIFLCAEDGANQLDVARFPKVETLQDVYDAIESLTNDEHDFLTLGVDSVTALEGVVWSAVCKKNGWGSIDDPEYKKGFNIAFDEWRVLLAALERLQDKRGMHIALIGHAVQRSQESVDVAVGSFLKWALAMYRGNNGNVGDKIHEWVDVMVFATAELTKSRLKDKIARGTGARVIHTDPDAAGYVAKTRYQIPTRLPLDWDAFSAAYREGPKAEKYRADIEAMLPRVSADVAAAVRETVTVAGTDTKELARIQNKLAALIAEGGGSDDTDSNSSTTTNEETSK